MELENIRDYWDSRAEGYSMSSVERLEPAAKEKWRQILLRNLPKKEAVECLDIGCGPGALSIIMAEEGYKVTAIDYSEKMLHQAKKNAQAAKVSITFQRMDAQKPLFAENSFDYIFCRDLTWNLEQPLTAYRAWLQLLRPKGHLLIMDSNYYLHYYNAAYKEEYDFRGLPEHKYMLGVDSTPINTIAKNLPLSKEIRPYWDMAQLLSLGAAAVACDVDRKTYPSPHTGKEESLIYSFRITAKK